MIKYLFSFFSTVVFPVHRPEKTFASFPRTFGDWVIAVYVNSDKRDNFSVHFIRSFGLFPFSEDAANKINFSIMIFICDTENINTVIDENTTNFRENIFVFYSELKRYYCPVRWRNYSSTYFLLSNRKITYSANVKCFTSFVLISIHKAIFALLTKWNLRDITFI